MLLNKPPKHICLLRLSAIGDITHMLPIVRTLQQQWPDTKLTWIIGKTEATLVDDIPGIEFIIFDKSEGLSAYKKIHQQLKSRQFDVLLHMQMALRASLIAFLIKAPIKLGFDKKRAKDLQWLFTTHQIAYQEKQHVIDSFFGFLEALGIQQRVMQWDIPLSTAAHQWFDQHITEQKPLLVINPCSAHSYRNWTAEGYAEVADYAANKYNMQIIITGGHSHTEKNLAENIMQLTQCTPINLLGKSTLKQLQTLLSKADLVIAPDTGPAHMATAAGTAVLGLYATTNPDRARAYNSAQLVVSRYDEAVKAKYGKAATEMPWGTRVKETDTMARITSKNVMEKLDEFFASTQAKSQ